MNGRIDEDRVKILAHEAINHRIDDFVEKFCEPKYKSLEKDRKERGEKIEKMDSKIDTLQKCMNGKFNKLYILITGVLVSIIGTLIAVLAK